MFNKLVSNLPFNPSLINQVSFYSKRLKAETSVRRLGFMLVALTMFLQLFAVLSPAQPSLAQDSNDLISGGVTTKDQLVQHCINNDQDYKTILAHFAISCSNLQNNSVVTTVNANQMKDGKALYSMGRNPQGAVNAVTGKVTNEVPVQIGSLPTLYMRLLSSWDRSTPSTYKALSVGNAFDVQFYLLFSCGNVVEFGPPPAPAPTPPPPPPPPAPKPPVVLPKVISCSNLGMNVTNGAKLNVGSSISVRGQAAGKNIPAGQLVSMRYDLVNVGTNKVVSSVQVLRIPFKGTVADDPGPHSFTLNKVAKFKVLLTVKIGPTGTVAQGSATGNCVKAVTILQPCQEAATVNDIKNCFNLHKSASNITQKIDDANNTTAKPGDIIDYKLSIQNKANIGSKVTFVENMTDVMEYADITNLHGGSLNASKVVSWPTETIGAKATITHIITIKVKDPIPNTPAPCPASSVVSKCPNTGSFDMVMTNVFNNTINIKLPKSIPKTTEITTTQTLTNTGPGASLIIGFSLMSVVGYFFARSRLMAKELDLVKAEYTSGGF